MLDGYAVLDDGEDDFDDDDEERSRAIPSRTGFGIMAEFAEKYPHAIQPRRFLFGLFTVRYWEYRCVYTNAEIELMCADRSRIKYSSSPKTKSKGKKPSRKAIDETIRIWNERQKKEAEAAAKKPNQII